MDHFNKDVTIEGVPVTLCATRIGAMWTWSFRCKNGLGGENEQELAPSYVVAWQEAEAAARAALRGQD